MTNDPNCKCKFTADLNNVLATANGVLPGVVDGKIVICNKCKLNLINISGKFTRAVTGEVTNFKALRVDSVECNVNSVVVKGCMEFSGNGTVTGKADFSATIIVTQADVVKRASATISAPAAGLVSATTEEFVFNQFVPCNNKCE